MFNHKRFIAISLGILITLITLAGCQSFTPTATPISATATPTPIPVNTSGPAISPLLTGNNVWLYPRENVWAVTGKAGLQIIRIGGNAFDESMPSTSFVLDWVNHIKAMGAEPMIQVSRYGGAEAAAKMVKYFNVETNNKVKYWNIGNEPNCNKADVEAAAKVAVYIKTIAPAMKAVDPSIKIFAPDECEFYEDYYGALFAGDNSPSDISGKIIGQNIYYVDGISWHRYVGYPPENVGIDGLTTAGANDYLVRIQKTRVLIDKTNAAQSRTGADALQWGIGEFNSNDGEKVCSYENGQMFAEVYGYIMKYGGVYGETWSMFENSGNCLGTDFGFVDAKMRPRSTYYHMQMIAQNFSGFYLDGTSTPEHIRAFGAVDPAAKKIAVMLMNLDVKDPQTCVIRLDDSPIKAGECRVNIPAGLKVDFQQTISSQTSVVLVFNLQGQLVKMITYAKDSNVPNVFDNISENK